MGVENYKSKPQFAHSKHSIFPYNERTIYILT